MFKDLTLLQLVGLLATAGVFGAVGWLLRRPFERRRNRAVDRQEEGKAQAIEAESRVKVESAEVGHVGALLNKAEQLADKMLALNTSLMECERMKNLAEIKIQEERAERERIERYAEGLRVEMVELQRQITDLHGQMRART